MRAKSSHSNISVCQKLSSFQDTGILANIQLCSFVLRFKSSCILIRTFRCVRNCLYFKIRVCWQIFNFVHSFCVSNQVLFSFEHFGVSEIVFISRYGYVGKYSTLFIRFAFQIKLYSHSNISVCQKLSLFQDTGMLANIQLRE